MNRTMTVGYVQLLCEVAVQEYGMTPSELLDAAALDAELLRDPSALVPESTFLSLLRFVLSRTGDRALGLRLARALDLRAQGFWGYALLSSATMRERMDVHLRYQRLRGLVAFTLTVSGDSAIIDCSAGGLPPDLAPVVLDFGFASACIQHRRRLSRSATGLQLWLSYREQPHHEALRTLVGGPVVFDAPCDRLQLPAADLDLKLEGDPHLAKLATDQLDAQLSELRARTPRDLLQRVREQLQTRLARDVSLEAIAADLGMSPRTLRRHLVARGASYQSLLEEVRHARAEAYLVETDEAVEWISAQLGYGDPSNFRRAFKRWTGLSPKCFRALRRSEAPARAAV